MPWPNFITSPRCIPACRYRLQGRAVGGLIDRSALHSRRYTFCRLLRFPARDNPQTLCRGWSPPARLRYTRNTGRAQQRSISAATGSSVVGSRIHPEPSHRSTFSWRFSRPPVKAYQWRISDQFLANVTKVKKCARRGVIRIGPVSVAPVGRIHLPRFFQLAGCGGRGPAYVCGPIWPFATACFRPDAFAQSGVGSASGLRRTPACRDLRLRRLNCSDCGHWP